MRWRCLFLGVLLGIAIAPASGRATWRYLRDRLAALIDAALRIGVTPSNGV